MKKIIIALSLCLIASAAYAGTMRDLTSGAAISDADLFVTRQGADTSDTSVTGTQLKAYIGSGGDFCDLGDVTCTSLTDNDVIKYVSATGDWANGAIGDLFSGAGTDSILIHPSGSTAAAHQQGDVAIGNDAVAGDAAEVAHQLNVAIGDLAEASDRKTTALGYNTKALNANCVAIGDSAYCDGIKAVSIGNDANVADVGGDSFSVAIGSTIDVDNADAIGIGQAVTITHDDAIVFGKSQSSEYADQFKYGAKYLALGEIATANRDTCNAAHEGAIIYNPTTNTIQLCDSATNWVDLRTGSGAPLICLAISDETSSLTTGTAKITWTTPQAMELTDVQASVATAPTGSVATFDINEAGTTILSTKITIDATEFDSSTAATAPVISDSNIAANSKLTFDIDGVGSTVAGAGAKICLIGNWN